MLSAEADYVLRTIEERGVRFIRLWFTDVLGFLKSFTITSQELEGAFAEGMGFDGSSIEGYSRIQESDMVAVPDAATFQVIPWKTEHAVARMFCDVYQPDGTPFDGDPRGVLKRQLKRAADLGYTFYVGPELEYFYFRSVDDPSFLDQGGYFDETPLDVATDYRKRTVMYLESMGIPVEYVHHEVAPSQHEIDLRYADALTMADNVMAYRLTVKEVAQEFGIYATFMPKPVAGVKGSGMHTHQSLFSGDRNAFFDAGDEYHLSATAKAYIAGILRNAPEITLVTNQWVNSYKRLIPGYEAPVYVCWARRNRSALVRVPMYEPGKEEATRIEYRSPDPACNPYLAFAAMLAAGLAGIEQGLELPPEASNNIYEMSEAERAPAGIASLPEDLHDAITLAERSEVLREALGAHVHEYLIRNKRAEWDSFFVPDSKKMLSEMARVTKPGGKVAAYVWDYAGGIEKIGHFWDAAVAVSPGDSKLDQAERFPICQPEPLTALFNDAELKAVSYLAIEIPTVFKNFDDYWIPFLGKQGAAPTYLASVDDATREKLRARLDARLPRSADGTIPLRATAWAVQGTVTPT